MDPDKLRARRAVFASVIRQIAEQMSLDQVPPDIAVKAWREFLRNQFFPGQSSEDVILRDDWNDTVLAIEAWAASRGVEFQQRSET